jgi:hypothetical protein
MKAAKKKKKKDPIDRMIAAANREILGRLIKKLSSIRPDIRRECLEFLKAHIDLSPDEKAVSDGEAIFALWSELEFELSELDEYGGGDYQMVDHVAELLFDVCERLHKHKIPLQYRRDLLDKVLSYIQSGNAGLDDDLYNIAYALCYDNGDLRHLAEQFEGLGKSWPLDHARRIYREIGDYEKYLELRLQKMEYGLDFYDLATFFWETNRKEKAIETAKQGLNNGKGRLEDLRNFLAERAKETGDRSEYLELQFAQAIDGLTARKYKVFQTICSKKEWAFFEPRMLKALERAWEDERLEIHMLRKEYDRAVTLLAGMRYPDTRYGGSVILKTAKRLEQKYPDQILSFYMSGLGNLNYSFDRKTYARKAVTMNKVRHMWVDVIRAPEKWKSYAVKVKAMNIRRPAFQEEFSKAVREWKNL